MARFQRRKARQPIVSPARQPSRTNLVASKTKERQKCAKTRGIRGIPLIPLEEEMPRDRRILCAALRKNLRCAALAAIAPALLLVGNVAWANEAGADRAVK